ncbi:hypothetical protein CA13_57400 [Planctomycetes bacterium CA13]|uniref:Uncharacterized protein n=1 Tax=Novipirellula herctigrandis TaxID=2527986 RepID=A0A5C5ZAA0_9BACT|nr:hypothetical protein CA13_57400 [Planctomycetes bacterium CA13]
MIGSFSVGKTNEKQTGHPINPCIAAGTIESLARKAVRSGQGWLCAPANPLGLSSA